MTLTVPGASDVRATWNYSWHPAARGTFLIRARFACVADSERPTATSKAVTVSVR